MEKLILIDGNSLINRAFYATPPLTTNDGRPTNAVFGFVGMLIRLLKEEKPTKMAVAFDLKAPTFRHLMYDGYKATRKPMPEPLAEQIPMLKNMLSLMDITMLEKQGFEADDIIGTVAKNTDIPTVIITGDRDSFQLVDEMTEVHFTKRGITEVDKITADNFFEKVGYNPSQVIDFKAIAGDSSDNIPGIKGVGEKTAKALIEEYGTVENLYEHTEDLKGKLKDNVCQSKSMAFLSKKLATIDTAVDLDYDLDNMSVRFPFSAKVKSEFISLDFKALLKKEELFDLNAVEHKVTEIEKREIKNKAELTPLLSSDSLYITFGDILSVYADGVYYHIKERVTLFDDGLDIFEFLTALKPFLSDEKKKIYVFNKKDFKHLLRKNGIGLLCFAEDISIMKYLADFTARDESLSDVITEKGLDPSAPSYALHQLYQELLAELESENMVSLYKNVELPLTDVLFDMEVNGFKADLSALAELTSKYDFMLFELGEKIYELAGEKFNINSPKQLGEILFDKLKLGKGKKNRKGYSTGAEILEELADTSEIVPLALRYRKIQKLKSTYAEGLQAVADKKTGLIHTKFNQLVTATGRLSSAEPNLQNIPVRYEEGREIRKCFIARDEEHILVSADYSQIELRLLAAFSDCAGLKEAFLSDVDVHTLTASKVFKLPVEKVTKEQRRRAKAVNFGIIYGISEYGLSRDLKIPVWEAKEYIEAYFRQYPEVKEYMDKNVQTAKDKGYVTTYLGRRRVIRELKSPNYQQRQFGERAAMNMPLQGSSADIIKIAMINVFKRLKKENLRSILVLQVHDELVIDALKSEKEKVEQLIKEEMENAVKLSVPLTVEVLSGETLLME